MLPDRTSILCNTQNSLHRSSVGRWRGRRSMVRVGRQNRRQAGTRDGRGVPFGQETPGGGERDEAHESASWSSKPCPKPMCKSFGSIEHWLLGHRRTQPVVNTAGTSMTGDDCERDRAEAIERGNGGEGLLVDSPRANA